MKLFSKPRIIPSGITPGDDVEEEDNVSGQSTPDDYCVDYVDWCVIYCEDDEPTQEKWQAWLRDHTDEFGEEGCPYIKP